ncbi:hypothetical protein NARC_60108 [Candidatus Nitrosocosmicus arcticus]|uniref:Uncharacterized protein n=1 Tax=Candidatus Nitrosocosmicus arcticus TaxID=2035267 RepID=A0A557SVV4_9ARCH|nr:hypothetical protein NARC_60108 [Candidatus Nitrosocosmicus arcticus]
MLFCAYLSYIKPFSDIYVQLVIVIRTKSIETVFYSGKDVYKIFVLYMLRKMFIV